MRSHRPTPMGGSDRLRDWEHRGMPVPQKMASDCGEVALRGSAVFGEIF